MEGLSQIVRSESRAEKLRHPPFFRDHHLNGKPVLPAVEAMELLAGELQMEAVEVRSMVSFYAFFSETPQGKIVIRVCDDVVDITLRVAMGALLDPSVAPSGALAFTDGAFVDASAFDDVFPYLTTPIPGSPEN